MTGNKPFRISIIILCVVVLANGVFWSVTISPDLWCKVINILTISKIKSIVVSINSYPERCITTGLGFLISILFLCYWYINVRGNQSEKNSHFQLFLIFIIGICYVLIFQFQRPNLPAELDPVSNPIFSGLKNDGRKRAITLENCSSDRRSDYRCEATLAGLITFDGPTDTGLFTKTRQYWSSLNDVDTFPDYMEVNWFCSERVVSAVDGSLIPSAKRLFKAIGVNYLFTDRVLDDVDVIKLRQVGGLRLYELKAPWSDVNFFPGIDDTVFLDMMQGLVDNTEGSIGVFDLLDGVRQELNAVRVSGVNWKVSAPPEFKGKTGVLFMNHPIEYHRGTSFPFTRLPMEGRWEIISDGSAPVEFPLTDVPFRIVNLSIGENNIIQYSLRHYYGWLLISIGAICMMVCLIRYERKNSHRLSK